MFLFKNITLNSTCDAVDSDLVRWGLHLLDGGGSLFPPSSGNNTASQTSNPSYESSTTSNYYNYANEGLEPNSMARSPRQSVTSDEVIAHVLQEELSSLAAAEEGAQSSAGLVDNSSKSTVLSQDWVPKWGSDSAGCSAGATGRESEDPGYGTAGVYQDSGLSNHFQSLGVEEEDTMAPRRAGTPDYEEYQHGSDDEFNLAIALSKSELAYDREVRRRLVGTFTLDVSFVILKLLCFEKNYGVDQLRAL